MARALLLLPLVVMMLLGSGRGMAEEFGKSFSEADCFLQGYAPLREPEKYENDPTPVRNRIRLRFKLDSASACRTWVNDYCRKEILAGERKVGSLKGYFRIKSADGNLEHAQYLRFTVGADCLVRDSTE